MKWFWAAMFRPLRGRKDGRRPHFDWNTRLRSSFVMESRRVMFTFAEG